MQGWFTMGLCIAAGLPALAAGLAGATGLARPVGRGPVSRPLGRDVSHGHIDRVLREVDAMADADASAQPDVAGWPALRGADVGATRASMQRLLTNWDPAAEPALTDFVVSYANITWGSTNVTLFGAAQQALAGGVEAALQATTQERRDGGLTAACAVLLAKRPDLAAGIIRQEGNATLVSLAIKTQPLPGAFTRYTLPVASTVPVWGGEGVPAGALQRNESTWCTYARKAMTKANDAADGPVLDSFARALAAMMGTEVEAVDVTRAGDFLPGQSGASLPLSLARALETLPSVRYDVSMTRLARAGFGGITFMRAVNVQDMALYNDTARTNVWPDGASVSAVANTSAIHLRSPRHNVDVVLVDNTVYGVIDAQWFTDSVSNSTRPLALRLIDPAGGAPDPALADRLEARDLNPALPNTTVDAVFDLPIDLVKRLPRQLYTV